MDIYEYIKSNEISYNTLFIPIVDNYEWNMAKHVKLTTLYLNSRFETGNHDDKPFRNIVLPAINLQHRAVEFAVKEIDFYIENKDQYYKSFLVRKYHEVWARKHNLATFLDELTQTYTDFGGVLIKKTKDAVPSVIPFQQLAFVDQTDIMSGPICEKHQYAPFQLKEMEAKGWKNVDEVIALAQSNKTTTQARNRQIKTPSKYVEVYEIHGSLPETYLNEAGDPNKFVQQMHIVTYYQDETGKDAGITLYSGKEKENPYKVFKRDAIYGRALGRGGVEELFEDQVWTNYSAIQQKELLDQASKMIYQTADPSFATRNTTSNLENGEVLVYADGKPLSQINNQPINMVPFENSLNAWVQHSKEISASYDTISGAESKSGMPFRLGMLLNQEAHSLHKYRKGQIGGQFLPEVYRDWIIPEIQKDLAEDTEFLATLSLDEMQAVAEQVVTNTVNKQIIEKILAGNVIDYGEVDSLAQAYTDLFYKTGNKKFFTIYKEDLKGLPIEIEVDITGENKNKALMAEKLSSVFTQIAQNPQILDNPDMRKIFNEILESSGMSPLSYQPTEAKTAVEVSQPQE